MVVVDRDEIPGRHGVAVDVLGQGTRRVLDDLAGLGANDRAEAVVHLGAALVAVADLEEGLFAVSDHRHVEAVPGQGLLGVDAHVGATDDDERVGAGGPHHLSDLDDGGPAERLAGQRHDVGRILADPVCGICRVEVLDVKVDELDWVAMLANPCGEPRKGQAGEDAQLLCGLLGQRLLVGSFVVLDEEDAGVLLGHGVSKGRTGSGGHIGGRLWWERVPVAGPLT